MLGTVWTLNKSIFSIVCLTLVSVLSRQCIHMVSSSHGKKGCTVTSVLPILVNIEIRQNVKLEKDNVVLNQDGSSKGM